MYSTVKYAHSNYILKWVIAAAFFFHVTCKKMEPDDSNFSYNLLQQNFNQTIGQRSFNGRTNCSAVNLTSEEYVLEENSSIVQYFNHSFNESDYIFHGNNVTVCFPYTEEFLKCVKWKFDSSEFIHLNNKTVQCVTNNATYYLGNYRMKNDALYVCIPNELLSSKMFYMDLYFIFAWTLSITTLIASIVINISFPIKFFNSCGIINQMMSMFLKYAFNILYQMQYKPKMSVLIFEALASEFILVSTFTWFHVVSFDFWYYLHPRRILQKRIKIYLKSNFLRCLYGWGTPILFLIAFAVTEEYDYCSKTIPVRGGIFANHVHLVLLYFSLCLLIIPNIVFFIATGFNLCWMADSVPDTKLKIYFYLRKLFIGLILVTIIPFVATVFARILEPNENPYLAIPETIIAFQGMALAILYSWALSSNTRDCKFIKSCRRKNPLISTNTTITTVSSTADLSPKIRRNSLTSIKSENTKFC